MRNTIEGYNNICRIIKENDLNFVAFAITPWHLIGVRSSLKYLSMNKYCVRGLLCIIEHDISGISIGEEQLREFDESISIIYFQDVKGNLRKQLRICAHFILNNIFFDTKGFRKIFISAPGGFYPFLQSMLEEELHVEVEYLVYDEGVQTYLKPIHHERENLGRHFSNKLKRSIYFLMDTSIRMRGNVTLLTLFTKTKHGSLEKNSIAVNLYKSVIEQSTDSISVINLERYKKAIVINSQTFFDNGEIERNEDITILREIINICKKCNHKVIIKLHPRDMHKERYLCLQDAEIDWSPVSQESILSSLEILPLLIIGFTTTTLLTANIFWNVKTVSIAELLRKSSNNQRLNMHIKDFEKTFSKQIEFVNDLDEFEKIVSDIR